MTWYPDELLAAHARDAGDRPALVGGDAVLSWAALDARVSSVTAGLRARGLTAGDRVAIDGSSPAAAIVAILAVLRAGGVAAPVPAGLTPRERQQALDVLSPARVLADDDLAVDGMAPAPLGFPARRDSEAPALIVLTSGTTGRPKGVVLSARAMAASADAWLGCLPAPTGWALPLGVAHVAGLGVLWRALRDGVPLTLLPPADPGALLATLTTPGGPSHVSLVPRQLARVLDVDPGGRAPAGVRAVLLGGGAIAPALVERAARVGWPVVATYGLSEMASGVTALPPEEALEAPHTAGRPLPGMSVTIEEAGTDGIGEIVVRGPSRSSGYVGDEPVPPAEPVRTGDLGRLDDAGRLIVTDRRTDRIVRGGENIDPSEVEAVLEAHPAIAEAAVVARSDDAWGQVPVAAIVIEEGHDDPGDDALVAYLRESLAAFKTPAAFARLDALPRTTGGKIRRGAVRALLAGEGTGQLARPGGDEIGWRVTGDGPRDVLLLHGTLSSAQQLDRLARALAADGSITVHALDRRGAGSSRLAQPRPLDVGLHIADILAYLDARGIRRAVLAGVSFGGVLALELAARCGDRVDGVVAYEPPYGLVADPERLAWFRALAEDTRRAHANGGAAGAAETFLRAVAGDHAWERLPDRTRAVLMGEGDGALSDAALTGLDPAGLARITVPVLLLTGGASEPFYAPIADELARRIPTARRTTLDAATHTSPITDPTMVAAAMRAIFDLVDAAATMPLEPAR